MLIGGTGADTMHGGSGADTFKFNSLKELSLGEGKQDVAYNFTSGDDHLDFSVLKGWSLVDANQVSGNKQLWTAQAGDDLILYGNSGGTLAADFPIKLVGISELNAGDFSF